MKFPLRVSFFLILVMVSLRAWSQPADTALVRALHKKTYAYISTYPDSLLFFRDSAFRQATRVKDHIGIAESFTDLGIYHWVKGNYAEAIRAYDTSNIILLKIKRPNRRVSNLTNLGLVHSRIGNYTRAIEFFYEALRIAEGKGDLDAQAKLHNSLGVVFKNQNNLEEAENAYRKALTLLVRSNNSESIAGCYTNLGNVEMLRKNYLEALTFQQKGLHIFDSLQNFRGMVTCYNNISDIHIANGNFTEALLFNEKALDLSMQKGFFSNQVSALLGIGTVQTALGNYFDAERSFTQGIQLAKSRNYRTEMVNLYKGLAVCYKKMNRLADALSAFERYTTLKDSIYNQQSVTAIANLRNAYELERKEASIQLLTKDNQIERLTRNRLITAITGIVIVAVVVFFFQRARIKKNKEFALQQKRLFEAEQALTKAELVASRQKGEELMNEITYKNKALTTYALSMVQKNEILEEVRESIDLMIKKPDSQPEHFRKLSRVIDYGFTLDKDWEDFKLYFEEVHHNFFTRLCERFPDLGGADLKLCALIRLNMNVKQSATILRISPDSVKVARHRLRKKFGLHGEDNLTSFIMSM